MDRALIIVDVQNDFCPNGALPVEEGDKIIPVINKLMGKFNKIYASKDWHPEKSLHFEKWPVHCIQNSYGAEFHKDLNTTKIDEVFLKGTSNSDDGYSMFEATNINFEEFLKKNSVKKLFITGLALDFCVKATALDAHKKGFETYIILDATEAVNKEKKSEIIDELKKEGIKLVVSSDLLVVS